jgi:dCMP deaminase
LREANPVFEIGHIPPEVHERPEWDEYFLGIAESVSRRATCLRRRFGAVVVSADHVIVGTGYNGAPRGDENCTCRGTCIRKERNIPSGTQYELCRSVHAEQNAIISGEPVRMAGGTLYLAGIDADTNRLADAEPCRMCWRFIKNARIVRVVVRMADGSARELPFPVEG